MGHPFGSTDELKKSFLSSFKESGVIAYACKEAGISRGTFHRWMHNSDFRVSLEDAVCESFNKHKKLWFLLKDWQRNDCVQTIIQVAIRNGKTERDILNTPIYFKKVTPEEQDDEKKSVPQSQASGVTV